MSLTAILALAEFVPTIAGWFGGDDAEETTKQVVDVAKSITGMDNESDAIAAIKKDPSLQIQFQQAMNPVIIARLENETKQQAEINATIRAELNSNDKFKSWWRPALGWIVSLNIGALMSTIVFVIIYTTINGDVALITATLTSVSTLMGSFTVILTMALGVLGINIKKRSDDKALTAGHPPKPNILGSLASKWLGK